MSSGRTFVIVGAGLAGAKTAEALRREGYDGDLVLIGDETQRPYERPPLSKTYLQGRSEKEKIYVHPEGWYAQHAVDLRLGTRVTRIELADHRVHAEHGQSWHYDKLLLATGASARMPPLPGADVEGVFTLRRVEDCERLRAGLRGASRVAIVGAGWIGLEVAAAARAADVETVLLERSELPLLRVLGRELAQVFVDLHRRHGVDLRCGAHVAEILTARDAGAERVIGVLLADGARIRADLVVIGAGATPNVELARAAGLAVGDGIHVDAHLRTSDPDVFAAGDVAAHLHPVLGTRIRVEHWANATRQPAVAAKSMLGIEGVYDRLPYFYSDQYELGMEYCGYVGPDGYDEVVIRPDDGPQQFLAFWMKGRKVLAGMNVGVWDQTEAIRRIVESRRDVDPAALADATVDLSAVLSGAQTR